VRIDPLDAHDRHQHFTKQSFDIAECCQDLINKRPFGDQAFYIFAHARTEEGQPGVKRLIWQPRLTKPKAQTNSMLFKAYPGTDLIKVIWMIPARELWSQYKKGNVTENKTVSDSIHAFQHNRNKLEEKESDDMTDEQVNAIYKEVSIGARSKNIKSMSGLQGRENHH
jgi:hypothetical protein